MMLWKTNRHIKLCQMMKGDKVMRKATGTFPISTILIVCCLGGIASGFSGGNGSEGEPYQISNKTQLEQVNNDLSAHYILLNSIDLTGTTYPQPVIAPFVSASTSGLTGSFDGDGHAIIGASVQASGSNYIGLFGYVRAGGEIKNLGVENCNMRGRYEVGGLVGRVSAGTFTNCYTTGQVNGSGKVGGLAGYNDGGDFIKCHSTAQVTSPSSRVGGLLGFHSNGGVITDSYATGPVQGTDYVGGLVGQSGTNGTISRSYYDGSVIGSGLSIGGLVGISEGTISDCYSTGSVRGNDWVGGLAGGHCSSSGASSYSMSRCYSDAFVEATSTNPTSGACGITAVNGGVLTACFWDVESCDTDVAYTIKSGSYPNYVYTPVYNNPGATEGKTTVEMRTRSTFTGAGWDFNAETTNGTDDLWHMPYGVADSPMLSLQRDIPGDWGGRYGVDTTDFTILAEAWGLSVGNAGYNDVCDLVDDDTIGIDDFALFIQNWLAGIY